MTAMPQSTLAVIPRMLAMMPKNPLLGWEAVDTCGSSAASLGKPRGTPRYPPLSAATIITS
jgi:hypothetical protein